MQDPWGMSGPLDWLWNTEAIARRTEEAAREEVRSQFSTIIGWAMLIGIGSVFLWVTFK